MVVISKKEDGKMRRWWGDEHDKSSLYAFYIHA
jgi:hypothetical protein